MAESPNPAARILVADDDDSVRWVLEKAMKNAGHEVVAAADGAQALAALDADAFDLALVDVRMPGADGFEVLDAAVARGESGPHVILLTAADTVKNAIEAMKRGAFDYVAKPFDVDEIEILVNRALENRRLQAEVKRLRAALPETEDPDDLGLVGKSRAMREVFKTIGRVAPTDETVLISGESGTGKELVARALHAHSPRANGPFVAVNCAAIPGELLESELFGYVRGAFTGAVSDRSGKLEAAANGTLLLDEVGDLPLPLQAKLLRVLQSREYSRLGETRTRPFHARVLAATNLDLKAAVSEGSFRKDLYYRLHVVEIVLPPLGERPDDIQPLAEHFLLRACRESGIATKELSAEALDVLEARAWPGNVRELENAVRRAVVMSRGRTLTPADFETEADAAGVQPESHLSFEDLLAQRLAPMLEQLSGDARARVLALVDRALIRLALERTGGNKLRAAEMLGVNRNTLHARMRELGIEMPRPGGKKDSK